MPNLLEDLIQIENDFYDNKDSRVLEIWEDAKFKWFFPKCRKKRIEKLLYKQYLLYKDAIKGYYLQH